MSTAAHPQTDGQTEVSNRSIKAMLRHYVNEQQSDWHKYLDLVEFAYNSSRHTSTRTSPFMLAYGVQPRGLTLDTPGHQAMPAITSATAKIKHMHELLHSAKENMELVQARSSVYHDKGRAELSLAVGDKVMIHRSLYKPSYMATSSTNSLDNNWVGPYKVAASVGPNAYRLDLPQDAKIHPVVSVAKLRKYNESSMYPRLDSNQPGALSVDGNMEYEVDKIVGHRKLRNGDMEYLVRWKGYTRENDTWETQKNLLNAKDTLFKYYERVLA